MRRESFDETGYAIFDSVLDPARCDTVVEQLAAAGDHRAGTRNLLDEAWCQELAHDLVGHRVVRPLLPAGAVAGQCSLFDKSWRKNWLVALHQDLSIPVRERTSHAGCLGWSHKQGSLYVQPPVSVLETLVAVRLHLDDCNAENGPLRVVPGSHRRGRLTEEAARAQRQRDGETVCLVAKGGVLLMRPLLLHASSKARVESRRRVLHFLFGPAELPCGLRWHRAV